MATLLKNITQMSYIKQIQKVFDPTGKKLKEIIVNKLGFFSTTLYITSKDVSYL